MYINKIACATCFGSGKVKKWVPAELNSDGICTLKFEDRICDNCNGKSYTTYPVFTVEEAVKIAEHFGFDIKGLEEEL